MSKTETAQLLAQQKSDSIGDRINQLTAALDNLPVIIGQGISEQVQPVIEIRDQLSLILTQYDQLTGLDKSIKEIQKTSELARNITNALTPLEKTIKKSTASHIKTAVITGLICGLVCFGLVTCSLVFLQDLIKGLL